MCGIFGQFRSNAALGLNESELAPLVDSLRHRGPDGGAYWTDAEQYFLGHRRLAIIDLSQQANQPMFSQDERHVIVFNGEIYNYLELREELVALGHVFHTQSDTEVIVAGYRQWHTDLPQRLIGMFAFALADREQRTLFLARDRFGEKPLYIAECAGAVTFASELRPLAKLAAFDRTIDSRALGQFLCLNYVPGNRTLFASVKKLAPATWRLYRADGTSSERSYWSLQADAAEEHGGVRLTYEMAARRLRVLLDKSVQITLRSDVPVALFLSGGIDSSLVAESAVRQGALRQAFCLDFSESSFSEFDKASAVAQRLGLGLERVVLGPAVLEDFVQMCEHVDDPMADSSALAVWCLAKHVAQQFKVAISGDGGDELFGGYLTYQATLLHERFVAPMPLQVRAIIARYAEAIPQDEAKVSFGYKLMRFLRAADLDSAEAHFTWNGTWLPAASGRFLQPEIARVSAEGVREMVSRHGLPPSPSLRDLQMVDTLEYLPNDILTKVDRMAMAFGLETRAPLLHPDIAAFAFALPDRLKVRAFSKPKVLLRHLAAQTFGPEIATAKKQGFSIPVHRWLRGPARHIAEDLLSKASLEQVPVLNATAVTAAKDQHMSGRSALGYELWGLMVLVAWFRSRVLS